MQMKMIIVDLSIGLQTVTASRPGFLPQQQDVVVIAGGTVTLDFILAPEQP